MNTPTDIITRTMPTEHNDFLFFQTGRIEHRYEVIPQYATKKSKKIIGFETGKELIPVFKLLGWGSSKAAAQRMAKV